MSDRLLIDFDVQGRVRVSTMRDQELPEWGDPATAVAPLDSTDLDDLRWYLEDYLSAPFAVYQDRGEAIAARLPAWGEALFASVFGGGAARDAFQRWRQRTARPGAGELVIRSVTPAWLGVPWELLREPGTSQPLVLDGVAVTRSLLAGKRGDTFTVGGDRLRVLMVIARPRGEGDVGYQMIARPLLERLAAVRGTVDLQVLRPPTLEALETTLRVARESGNPFQIVHFDGHGVLTGPRAAMGAGAPLSYAERPGEGVLAFEKPTGGSDLVPAGRIAAVLGEAQVPVVVLNACQSGAVGKQLEAAVATRLLAGGAAAVVAMAYSVYAVAAAEFMTAFYERLFAGDTLTQAVRAGRARMARQPDRPTPRGDLPLADWVIPVHYLRREVQFPDLRAEPGGGLGGLSFDEALDRLRHHDAAASPTAVGVAARDALAADGVFVGRDDLFYRLEVAAREHRVVVLHGQAGTGKSELAKAFGRWWRDTGGVEHPSLVIWHSFKPGVASFGLSGVLSAIGSRVFGADFSRLEADDQRRVVVELLAEHRLLLIWDNFESVASMPDDTQATPPLDAAGRAELADFLADAARGGRSAVLVTSRTPETWLNTGYRLEVTGLTRLDSIGYADILLTGYPGAQQRRQHRQFDAVLEWLGGHPMSMRVLLPHLDTTDPDVLLAGLRGTVALPHVADTATLATSLTYSLTHLKAAEQRMLVAVSLFEGVVDANVLGLFSRHAEVPPRFRGKDSGKWAEVLERAAHLGLLTTLRQGMWGIHPALPSYLTGLWRAADPAGYPAELAAARSALLDAYAVFGILLDRQVREGMAAVAFTVIELQRRTMGALLGYALDAGLWAQADGIVQALNEYWDRSGLTEEARHWGDRARLALEDPDGTPSPLDTPAGGLWLFLASSEANRLISAGRLDSAEIAYTEILAVLRTRPETLQQRRHLATGYHQLGVVALGRGRLDEAEQWYRRSLTIDEELGDRPGMARTYHQFGLVAQGRGRLDEAEQWYRQSLTIKEELGNRPGMARTYHQLGVVAYFRGRLDEAEQWYRQSLTINEELGNRPDLASSYHQLGLVALGRGRLDEAEQWYRQSLTIEEELGNRLGMAKSYGQLGLVAEQRGNASVALEWIVRCVGLFEEFPHPMTGPGPAHLARLTRQLGMTTLHHVWTQVTGTSVPTAITAFVDAYHDPADPVEGT